MEITRCKEHLASDKKYLRVLFTACSTLSSPNPGATKAVLPTNALWLCSAEFKIKDSTVYLASTE